MLLFPPLAIGKTPETEFELLNTTELQIGAPAVASNTEFAVPAPVACIALVELPYKTPLDVNDAAPVPPFVTGNVPVTAFVLARFIAENNGFVPFDINTEPAVPAFVNAYAEPLPYATAPLVGVAFPAVPPLLIPRVPFTAFALESVTELQDGTPPSTTRTEFPVPTGNLVKAVYAVPAP